MEINFNTEKIITNYSDKRVKSYFFCWYHEYDRYNSFLKKKWESLFNKFKSNNDIVDNINNTFYKVSRTKQGYKLIFLKKLSICIKDVFYIIQKKIYYSRKNIIRIIHSNEYYILLLIII